SQINQVVSGLSVELQGTSLRSVTDSLGRFRFTGLSAGDYTLTISRTRGPVLLRRPIALRAGQTMNLTLDLAEGSATLEPIVVTAARPLHVIGHLPAVQDNVIYAGKKTEIIALDSLHANLPQDIERQILGRIPGAHFSETAAAGFPSNGV